jgi:GTPase SAR1 family protein
MDVGGQSHERKYWSTLYNDTTGVIVMISLTDFAVFTKDTKTGQMKNKLQESLDLLRDLVSQDKLARKPFVVLLNKSDILRRVLDTQPFTVFDPKCEEKNSKDKNYVISHIKGLIKQINDEKRMSIASYVTNATDTNLIQGIFDNLIKSMLKGSLQGFV